MVKIRRISPKLGDTITNMSVTEAKEEIGNALDAGQLVVLELSPEEKKQVKAMNEVDALKEDSGVLIVEPLVGG